MTTATRQPRWLATLHTPVDAAALGIFRIVFGLAVAWDAWRYLAYGWVTEYYVRPVVHFTYFYLDWVQPWPGWGMYLHYWCMSLCALCVAAGLWYRVTSALLCLAMGYVFLLEQSVYMNHHYLMLLVAGLLAVMPAHRAYAVDRWRYPDTPATVGRWTIWLLRFQLCVVYAYGALAKLNPDWLRGEPMYSLLMEGSKDIPAIAHAFPPALVALAIAYGGLVVDALLPVLLLRRRTLLLGLVVAYTFHLLNAIFLRIGVFSYLMMGALLIFLPPDWPRWRGRELWHYLWGSDDVSRISSSPPVPHGAPLTATQRLGYVLLHCYVIVQLVVPLRHWLYPGRVGWTEEGHRFAWHMKLRVKRSQMRIHVFDPATQQRWTIDPQQDLIPRQLRKLHTFPDILLQYVHYHRDRLREQGIVHPVITVEWWCALNGAAPRLLVDPTVNLAAVERSWRPATWLQHDSRQQQPM